MQPSLIVCDDGAQRACPGCLIDLRIDGINASTRLFTARARNLNRCAGSQARRIALGNGEVDLHTAQPVERREPRSRVNEGTFAYVSQSNHTGERRAYLGLGKLRVD